MMNSKGARHCSALAAHICFSKKMERRWWLVLRERKPADKYAPSVDMMMSSLAEVFGSMAMGVVLTGMGNDGAAGMLDIKKAGGYTIVESEETAVVFGMPSEVIKAGAAGRVLPISEIPDEMIRLIKQVG